MKSTVKALLVPAPGKLRMIEIEPPALGPYDARVRIEVCGICNSTDAKLIDGEMGWAPPMPFLLGHESVGVVTQVGPRVKYIRIGDRVTRPVAFWQGSRQGMNVAMGGFAEQGIVRDGRAMADDGDATGAEDYLIQRQLVVPPNLSPTEAALSISLSETASVYLALPPIRGKTLVVAGTGAAGLAFMLWAKLGGAARVIALGRRANRLEKARELGADQTIDTSQTRDAADQIRRVAGGAVDGIIEATGDAVLANSILPVIADDGFACAYGVTATHATAYDPRWSSALVREQLSYNWVADLLARRWVQASWFTSPDDLFGFDDAPLAIEQVRKGQRLKAFIQISA